MQDLRRAWVRRHRATDKPCGNLGQSLATEQPCTQQSNAGRQYGALCYDVGGCCPAASADKQEQLKGDTQKTA